MYERLKELCKKRGINITKLCEEVTNSSGNLSTWKKGYMRSDYLALVAERLQCSTDYLVGRTDNPNMTCINGENGIQAVVGGAIEHNTVTISPTDEMTKEIALLLSELTYRQKTELMKEIYDFVDNVKKGND